MELHLFEVVGLEKIDLENRNIALVELYLPEYQEIIPEMFLLDKRNTEKLASFFRSIGEKRRGENYRMKWDDILGKRGICTLTKSGTVESFVDIPQASNLIQKYGAEEISLALDSIRKRVEGQNQIFTDKLEFLLGEVRELDPNSESFEEDKNNILKYINTSIRYELTYRKKIMVELEHSIRDEVRND